MFLNKLINGIKLMAHLRKSKPGPVRERTFRPAPPAQTPIHRAAGRAARLNRPARQGLPRVNLMARFSATAT